MVPEKVQPGDGTDTSYEPAGETVTVNPSDPLTEAA